MKISQSLLIVVAAGSMAVAALSAEKPTEMHGMNMGGMNTSKAPAPAAATTHTATGLVKAVDAANGKVTLSHDPIKTLNWPAMTMGFAVKDKAMLSKFKVGSKVEVQLAQQGNDYVIVSVK